MSEAETRDSECCKPEGRRLQSRDAGQRKLVCRVAGFKPRRLKGHEVHRRKPSPGTLARLSTNATGVSVRSGDHWDHHAVRALRSAAGPLAGDLADASALAGDLADASALAGDLADVSALAALAVDLADVAALAGDLADASALAVDLA